jgi:hypothetical protein
MEKETKDSIIEFISRVIEDFKSGDIFDSHLIIQQMLKTNSNLFYDFVRTTGSADTKNAHGQLAKIIGKVPGVTKLFPENDKQSWSENIHGNVSTCTAWVKR